MNPPPGPQDAVADSAATTRRFGARREALISAASRLYNERGVIGTTLAEVAASVGLIKNSITYYFRRKEDLTVACFNRTIRVYDELILRSGAQGPVADRVVELLRLQVTLQGDIAQGRHPPVVGFHEIRALPSPHVEAVFASYTAMFRNLRQLLQGAETAHWPRAHLNARAHLLISCALAVRTLITRYEPEDHGRLVERLADILLHGIHGPTSHWAASGAEREWLGQMPERDVAAQFLRVATELINEQGYGGASVNRIAEKLSLTKGGFYYYNDNKGDLVAQCFERSVATIRKAVNLTESYGGPAWEHMCSIVRGLVRFQLSQDGPLLRSTANSALPDPAHRAHVTEELGRVIERISGVVVSGLIDGSIRPVDATLAAHAVLCGINATAELKRWVRTADEDNASDLYARPILQGLLCPID